MNSFHEIVVAFAGKGVDLRPNDYITHADGVRVLSGWEGGIEDFLQSGEKEAVVPIVDDEDVKFGGHRLKGFMMLQAVQPRKLGTRRGDISFDMEEGGPAPSMKLGELIVACSMFVSYLLLLECLLYSSIAGNIVIGSGGAKTTSDPSYSPPPHGGGQCISRRDCYPVPGQGATGGLCTEGVCACTGDYTGSHCQVGTFLLKA